MKKNLFLVFLYSIALTLTLVHTFVIGGDKDKDILLDYNVANADNVNRTIPSSGEGGSEGAGGGGGAEGSGSSEGAEGCGGSEGGGGEGGK